MARTYDDWKTTNPEDEALGAYESYAECDCCGTLDRLRQCWAAGGLETWACAECRHDDDDTGEDDDDQLRHMTETED